MSMSFGLYFMFIDMGTASKEIIEDEKSLSIINEVVEEAFDDLPDIQKQVACRMAIGEKQKEIRKEFGISNLMIKSFLENPRFHDYKKFLMNKHLEKMKQLMLSRQKKYIDKIEELADNNNLEADLRVKTWFDLLALTGVTPNHNQNTPITIAGQVVQSPTSDKSNDSPQPQTLDEIDAEIREIDNMVITSAKEVVNEESIAKD